MKALRIFSSLQLTILLLSLALVLIFVGTLGQVHEGLYAAQNRYFRSFFVYLEAPGFPRVPIFPGGWLLGGLLLINLISAHAARFKLTRKKIGIFIVHGGLILLLLGGLFTDLFQVESYLRLSTGEAKNYSTDHRQSELVFIDPSPADHDNVVAIPAAMLREDAQIQDPRLPCRFVVRQFLSNSNVRQRAPMMDIAPPASTQGAGRSLLAEPLPPATAMNENDVPSAVIELLSGEQSLGTWLVSTLLDGAQPVQIGGRTWLVALRGQRYYTPTTIQLVKFTHESYQGTDIPSTFASRVLVSNARTGERRETVISMNQPLRYEGRTYYQSGFDQRDPNVTILQVVRNPSWLVPYISCALIGLGLVVQFLSHLIAFTLKRRRA